MCPKCITSMKRLICSWSAVIRRVPHSLVTVLISGKVTDIVGKIWSKMEGLKAKLLEAYTASGNKKVNIISHSMGGLLVQCFLSMYHDVSQNMLASGFALHVPPKVHQGASVMLFRLD